MRRSSRSRRPARHRASPDAAARDRLATLACGPALRLEAPGWVPGADRAAAVTTLLPPVPAQPLLRAVEGEPTRRAGPPPSRTAPPLPPATPSAPAPPPGAPSTSSAPAAPPPPDPAAPPLPGLVVAGGPSTGVSPLPADPAHDDQSPTVDLSPGVPDDRPWWDPRDDPASLGLHVPGTTGTGAASTGRPLEPGAPPPTSAPQPSPSRPQPSPPSPPPPAPSALLTVLADRLPATLRGGRLDPGRSGAAALTAVALLAAVVTAGVAWRGRPVAEPVAPPDVIRTGVPDPAAAGADPGTVVVAVAGDVVRPGVVTLPVGSRVADALTAAGGATAGTDLGLLNLARRLVDGEQVVVGPAATAAAAAAAGSAPTGGAAGGPLDLNTASAAQLDGLPGIGPVLAERIVAWRTRNGRFAAVDQLREVPGIGESKYAQLEGLVRV